MWLVNNFGRVVLIEDEEDAQRRIDSGRMRKATQDELARHMAEREANSLTPGGVFYSTVRRTPDGYGMSRDHLKFELSEQGVPLEEVFNDQKVSLLYNYPYSLIHLKSDVRLIYTMFESDKIPEEWPDYLHEADEVIVPSKFCQIAFANAGISSTVVPLGYNSRAFKYMKRPKRAVFTFIHYDSFNLRKGFQEVLEAFSQEFTHDEPVRLILKTVQEHTGIPIAKGVFPNIEVVKGEFTERELSDLLASADCMVYPSRGEGFGITPLEAMATGLPAIVPNAHGISEYFDERYMLEVKLERTMPALNNRFKGQNIGNMVVCDVADLRNRMRYAFENQEKMGELGMAASEYVKKFSYTNTAAALTAIIKKWQDADVPKRHDSKYLRVERVS